MESYVERWKREQEEKQGICGGRSVDLSER